MKTKSTSSTVNPVPTSLGTETSIWGDPTTKSANEKAAETIADLVAAHQITPLLSYLHKAQAFLLNPVSAQLSEQEREMDGHLRAAISGFNGGVDDVSKWSDIQVFQANYRKLAASRSNQNLQAPAAQIRLQKKIVEREGEWFSNFAATVENETKVAKAKAGIENAMFLELASKFPTGIEK